MLELSQKELRQLVRSTSNSSSTAGVTIVSRGFGMGAAEGNDTLHEVAGFNGVQLFGAMRFEVRCGHLFNSHAERMEK
jgi:hypothetical protein